jgi:hypothetical protein
MSAMPQPQENKKSKFRVASNGIISISNCMKIHPGVLDLNHVDRQPEEWMNSPAL